MSIALALELIQALAQFATNPIFKGRTDVVAEILGLGGFALQQYSMLDADRKILLGQIREANAAGRGLTPEQRAGWRQQHVEARDAINAYFDGLTH
jgi:hypothetical protein